MQNISFWSGLTGFACYCPIRKDNAGKKITIPTCQRLVNAHYMEHPELLGGASGPGGGGEQQVGRRKEPGEGAGAAAAGGAGE